MNIIRTSWKLLGTKTPFEKSIVKFLCLSDNVATPEKEIKTIVAGLQDDDKNPIMMHNVNYLLDKLGSTKKWEDIAKLLYITHRAMKCESLVFIREFEKRDFNNIVSLPEHKEDIKLFVRYGLIKYYHKMLKTYAADFISIQKCKNYTREDLVGISASKDREILFHYAQIKEWIMMAVKIEDFLISSMEILDIPLIQEIGGLVLKDCYDLYNMLNSFITNTIPSIFDLPNPMTMLLDNIYTDLIRMAKPITSLYQFKNAFSDTSRLRDLELYYFDKEFNKREELYVNGIKKSLQSNKDQPYAKSHVFDKPMVAYPVQADEGESHRIFSTQPDKSQRSKPISFISKSKAHPKEMTFEKKTLASRREEEQLLTHMGGEESFDLASFRTNEEHIDKKKVSVPSLSPLPQSFSDL